MWLRLWMCVYHMLNTPNIPNKPYEKKSSINLPIWVFFVASRMTRMHIDDSGKELVFSLIYHFWCHSMRELNLSVNLSNVLFIRALDIWKKRKQKKRNIITMWTT